MTHALRLFRRAPAFTLAALVTLALGIGANTAIFSLVDGAILRPLPFDEPGRLVTAELTNPATGDHTIGMMPRGFLDWREHADVFEALSLAAGGIFTIRGAGEPEEVRVIRASSGFFEVLRTTPLLGRTFHEDDEQVSRSHVAIISYGFWRDRFAAASDVVGRALRLDDDAYEIVGVLPPDFEWPVASRPQTGIFLPLTFSAEDRQYGVPQSFMSQATARLRNGVTVQQAEQVLGKLQERFESQRLPLNRGYTRVTLTPMIEQYVSDARQWMLTLLGAVALVLLIACANVSNLFLAQGATRARELMLRGALGASRWRLARQLLLESLLLSTTGAVAGFAIASWSIGLVRAALPTSVPRAENIGLDLRVLAFATFAALATGVLCGLFPAIQASRNDLAQGLRQGTPGAVAGHHGRRLRSGLARLEVALAVTLLVGSGLFISSFTRLLLADQGFDPSGITSMRITASGDASEREAQHLYIQSVLDALHQLPAVEAAATTSGAPYASGSTSSPVRFPGGPASAPGSEPTRIIRRSVTPGFLELLRVRVRSGRTIATTDTAGSPAVAVINEAAARRFLPDGNALGQQIEFSFGTFSIVGIVGDMRYNSARVPDPPVVFLPTAQASSYPSTLVVRSSPGALASVLATVRSVDPRRPISDVRTASDAFGRGTATPRFNALLMTTFATLALVIAATGVFGVIATLVTQRTREVGVRVALGARPRQVVGMFLREGLGLVATGLAAGLLAAWWLSRIVEAFLYGVRAHDPWVFGAAGVLLSFVGLAATWIPARRAAQVDPLAALRAE